MTAGTNLLCVTALGVIALAVLIGRFKVQAFLALTVAAGLIGLGAGMSPPTLARAFCDGLGNVLGTVAPIIGLGAMLGRLLGASGGAEAIAHALVRAFGPARVPLALACAGFVVGVPVFFGVGLVLLLPVVFTLTRQTGAPLLGYALPLVAGLSVVHCLAPPHPGPMAAVELLGANVGKTLWCALLVGLPTVLLTGPLLAPVLARRHAPAASALAEQWTQSSPRSRGPGLAGALATILLPVFLMLGATLADVALAPSHPMRLAADFLGHPVVALLAAVLVALWSLGARCGFDRRERSRLCEECLGPVAAVILVIGAGGGLSAVLVRGGVGAAMVTLAQGSGVSPLVLGWLCAALVRVATGSATVAITTAASLLAPVAAAAPAVDRELLVVALGAGSAILSHVNDGGFWMVKEYLGLDLNQTLTTWTLIETAVALVALALVLVLNAAVGGLK
jgi:GntP family gluconate:H+ symporter